MTDVPPFKPVTPGSGWLSPHEVESAIRAIAADGGDKVTCWDMLQAVQALKRYVAGNVA